jgi:hypothetical protein
MKRLGYVEGVNLIVERYSSEGQLDRYAEMLHEVVTCMGRLVSRKIVMH